MKTQIFLDGNKRASVIFANHYLISHGGGFLVISESHVPEFKRLLVRYYEDEDISAIAAFMKENCWKTMWFFAFGCLEDKAVFFDLLYPPDIYIPFSVEKSALLFCPFLKGVMRMGIYFGLFKSDISA